MDQMTLLYVMTAFVIIAAIALCIQAGMLMGMYKTTKSIQADIKPLLPKVESLVETTRTTVEQSRKQIADVTTSASEIFASASEILASAKDQVAKVEDVVTDATSRAKVQLERVELVLDDTLSRAHETVATVHDGIMRPLREVNGIAVGIKTALAYLARGDRPSVDQATSDEEMFI